MSKSATAYVVKAWKLLRCEYTRKGYSHPACGTQTVPAGTYTLHVSVELFYPGSVYSAESAKPVQGYYGIRVGSRHTPPSTVQRDRTFQQHGHGTNTTVFDFTKKVTVPSQAYFWAMNWCTVTTEQNDGFGLPGTPGSHMCGQTSIPEKLSPNKLG